MLFDEKWFVACDPHVRRLRVINRHISTGNGVDLATKRADENDVPNGLFIDEQSRLVADLQIIESIEEI